MNIPVKKYTIAEDKTEELLKQVPSCLQDVADKFVKNADLTTKHTIDEFVTTTTNANIENKTTYLTELYDTFTDCKNKLQDAYEIKSAGEINICYSEYPSNWENKHKGQYDAAMFIIDDLNQHGWFAELYRGDHLISIKYDLSD